MGRWFGTSAGGELAAGARWLVGVVGAFLLAMGVVALFDSDVNADVAVASLIAAGLLGIVLAAMGQVQSAKFGGSEFVFGQAAEKAAGGDTEALVRALATQLPGPVNDYRQDAFDAVAESVRQLNAEGDAREQSLTVTRLDSIAPPHVLIRGSLIGVDIRPGADIDIARVRRTHSLLLGDDSPLDALIVMVNSGSDSAGVVALNAESSKYTIKRYRLQQVDSLFDDPVEEGPSWEVHEDEYRRLLVVPWRPDDDLDRLVRAVKTLTSDAARWRRYEQSARVGLVAEDSKSYATEFEADYEVIQRGGASSSTRRKRSTSEGEET